MPTYEIEPNYDYHSKRQLRPLAPEEAVEMEMTIDEDRQVVVCRDPRKAEGAS